MQGSFVEYLLSEKARKNNEKENKCPWVNSVNYASQLMKTNSELRLKTKYKRRLKCKQFKFSTTLMFLKINFKIRSHNCLAVFFKNQTQN